MLTHDLDHITFSDGTKIPGGCVGLDYNGTMFDGYDCVLRLSSRNRMELAAHMIKLWIRVLDQAAEEAAG